MSLRILLITVTVIIIVAILGWKGLGMRKEIPSQEVVPLNNAIAIISGESGYLADRLKLKIHTDSGKSEAMVYDKKGVCLIEGLSNQKQYTIEINRSDLKGMILYKPLTIEVTPREKGSKYFILVGASVGKAWKFDEIPNRMKWGNNIVLGYRTKYNFDKSDMVKSIVALPVPVTGVIIKECAAYFPRDIEQSQKAIKEWVTLLASNQITPILATVVPVTQKHDSKYPGRFASILAFNHFIREYASREGISVLDLEKALRISDQDWHLRTEYAQPDGLHLLRKAYAEVLDGIVLPIINSAVNDHPKE